jgi:hypothetical protein
VLAEAVPVDLVAVGRQGDAEVGLVLAGFGLGSPQIPRQTACKRRQFTDLQPAVRKDQRRARGGG